MNFSSFMRKNRKLYKIIKPVASSDTLLNIDN